MPTLLKSAHLTCEYHVASRLVCLVRTPQPFVDAAMTREEIAHWERSLVRVEPSQLGVLLDWRLAPLTIDPEVHRELVSGTDAIARRFARQALLMVSALGALQASRLSRTFESAPVVFTDEAAAYTYATSR